jgi:protein-S-isoprenylcysteine O-methyltransferase Ste14
MALDTIEKVIRYACGVMAVGSMIFAVGRLLRVLHRVRGRVSGKPPRALQSSFFYIVASIIFGGVIYLLWIPLPFTLSQTTRWGLDITGAVILLLGLGGYQWGHFTLGRMFAGSSSLGAQLTIDHKLVTAAPFDIVRHPMYLSLQIATFGAMLLFRTWAMLLMFLGFIFLFKRARREEEALKAEFGEVWMAYAKKVPFWFPRLGKQQNSIK